MGGEFGFWLDVILRTAAEMRDVIARNPFAKRRVVEPGKLLLSFSRSDAEAEVRGSSDQVLSGGLGMESDSCKPIFPNALGRSKQS